MTQYSGKVIRKNPVTPTQASASGVWKLNEQAAAIRNNTWPVAGVPDPISRSVRLRSSASAYLNRTPATTTNQQTFTLSFWTKRGTIGGSDQTLFSFGNGGGSGLTFEVYWGNSNTELVARTLNIGVSAPWEVASSAVFRDPSAWYHIVIAVDTPQATNTNRVKMYVNGVQITAFRTATWPTQNYNTGANTNTQHRIGLRADGVQYLDGYLTEINFIDGQALTPSSFGTTDPLTGAWIPMAYTGTYGTNGFYVDFRDNTSTTTLGYDYSGNSNNWTANNISLTAGSTYDSMLDVPTPWIGYSTTTDTSAVTRGNYSTLNPVGFSFYTTRPTLSAGNLDFSDSSTSNTGASGTMGVSSGKWYFEMLCTSSSGVYAVGLKNPDNLTQYSFYRTNGAYSSTFGGGGVSGYSSWTNGDVIGVAWDADTGKIWFAKNNTWQSGSPSAGTSPTNTYTPGITLVADVYTDNSAGTKSGSFNFGQRPLSYSPPSGFKTLCATNLPTPTILNGAQYMAATTYTGTGATQSISNAVNGVSMQPDLVWLKTRSAVSSNLLYDTSRGVLNYLSSNQTAAEASLANSLTAFNSNGFTLGSDNNVNQSTVTFVGWQWRAGGTPAVTNTNGSITSTVSVNTVAGFSIATYTGTGANATVGHGLGVTPGMVIVKRRNTTGQWIVQHTSFASGNNYMYLNGTAAVGSEFSLWNSTKASSTVISIGTNSDTNASGSTYVAYSWAPVSGYSAFGSYTGNGSSDGPFVYLGFRPAYVMIKRTDSANDWAIHDKARIGYNVANYHLLANSSSAEFTDIPIDFLSNGFKPRGTSGTENASGGTYIYAAFAENPFKYSNAR